jgi:hypothetical protein
MGTPKKPSTKSSSGTKQSRGKKKKDEPAKPSTDAPKALAIETRLLVGQKALTQIERRAFREQFSEAQCDEFGSRTKAEAVCRDARAWAPTIDAALRKHPEALRRYGRARFAWLLECIRDLSEALEAQRAAQGSVGASKRHASSVKEAALQARDELLETLEILVGGSAGERGALSTATGTTESPASIARSLRDLAELAEGWLKRDTEEAKALVTSVDLATGDVDTARRAAEALDRAVGDSALEGKSVARDLPSVNRVEGRVLLEMRTVMRVFERVHARSAVVPRLVPGPGTRSVLGRRSTAASKVEDGVEAPPEQPGTG